MDVKNPLGCRERIPLVDGVLSTVERRLCLPLRVVNACGLIRVAQGAALAGGFFAFDGG